MGQRKVKKSPECTCAGYRLANVFDLYIRCHCCCNSISISRAAAAAAETGIEIRAQLPGFRTGSVREKSVTNSKLSDAFCVRDTSNVAAVAVANASEHDASDQHSHHRRRHRHVPLGFARQVCIWDQSSSPYTFYGFGRRQSERVAEKEWQRKQEGETRGKTGKILSTRPSHRECLDDWIGRLLHACVCVFAETLFTSVTLC